MANLPNPVTRKEQYLSVMAKNTAQYPEEPITREEMYLDYLCKNGTGGGSGGTTNYNRLTNRPQINGNTLEGNLTAEDLGLQPENLVVTLTQNGESITADKSYADINQAYTDGKDIYAVIEGNIVPFYGKAGTTYIFQSVLGVQVTDFELNSEDTWSVETINIIANSTRPGGIIADEKTDDDTVEVHVDSKTGKAYVNASQDTTTTPPIINTVSGDPITLTDSSDNLLQGFEMDGKTEQDGTPTPESPVPVVNAGNWNEETQKWEYEIEVGGNDGSSQTVLLTSDRPLTKWDKLEKRNGQWGWVYKSEEKQVTQNDSFTYSSEGYFNLNNFLQADINKLSETKCNYFIYNKNLSKDNIFWIDSSGTGLRIKSSKFENMDELKLWLSENDVRILYCTYTETFTPLTPEESAALDALVSYYPTTVISNQQGLNMTVDYIADTKTYIDNKFAELQHSLANTNAQLLGGN